MPALNPRRGRPRISTAGLLLLVIGCEDASLRPAADPADDNAACNHTATIGEHGGTVCADRHTLYLPRGALTRPTVVRLSAEPIDDQTTPDGLRRLAGAAFVLDPPQPLRRPSLWTAPVTAPGEQRSTAGSDLAVLAADDDDARTDRRAHLDGRHLPALVNHDGTLAAALVTAAGRYAIAEPLADGIDRIAAGELGCVSPDPARPPAATDPASPLLCHALDAHRPPPPLDGETAGRIVDALYRSPLVTRRLAGLLQSDARARSEFAALIPADGIVLGELGSRLRESLDASLCITEPFAGDVVILERAADMLDALGHDGRGGVKVRRDAALALAARALLAATTRALAAAYDPLASERLTLCDEAVFAERHDIAAGDRRASDEAAWDRLGAEADDLDVPTLTRAGLRWDFPPAYARAIAGIAGDPGLVALLEATTEGDAEEPAHLRCHLATATASGPTTLIADHLSLLAEHAWLTEMLTELDEQGALQPIPPGTERPSLERVLVGAMEGRRPLITALLRLLEDSGRPLTRDALAWNRRRSDLEAIFALPMLTASPNCVTPPIPPTDAPDPCSPRLASPAHGATFQAPVAEDNFYIWYALPHTCRGDRQIRYALTCGPGPATLDTRRETTETAHDLECSAPGDWWWWQVSWTDPSGEERRSDPARYRIEPLPDDPCDAIEAGDDCVANPGTREVIDCRPTPERGPSCNACRDGRCVPPDEIDADALRAPVDGFDGGEAGERIGLDCAGEVYAPIGGEVRYTDRGLCIVGAAFQICLGGVTPDRARPLDGCRVTAGAALGTCADELVIEGMSLDGRRRPLPPPGEWPPRPADGDALRSACCRSPEACNGEDDDCDGQTDEETPTSPCARACGADGPVQNGQLRCDAAVSVCAPERPCPPRNDRCDRGERWQADRVGARVALTPRRGDTAAATSDHPAARGCGALGGGDVWYDLHIDRPGFLTLSIEAPGCPARVALRRAAGAGGACADEPALEIACGQALARVAVEPGDYQVVVDGAGDGGLFELRAQWQDAPGACIAGLPAPDPDGRTACLDGDTVVDGEPRAGQWICDHDGRGRACVGQLPGPDNPIVDDRQDGPIDPEMEPEPPPGPEPEPPPLNCRAGQRELNGACVSCMCRVVRHHPNPFYGNLATNPVMQLVSRPAVLNTPPACPDLRRRGREEFQEHPCEQFPLVIAKVVEIGEHRPTFDPSEANDETCLVDANDDTLQISPVTHRIVVSETRAQPGSLRATVANARVGLCELLVSEPLDLRNDLIAGDVGSAYLHVVRDACEGSPDNRDWWWSEITEVSWDCGP